MCSQCACVLYCVHSQYVHCMDHNCFADCILFAMHTHCLESGTYTGSLFLILIWCGTTRSPALPPRLTCREKNEMSSAEYYYRKAVEANPEVSTHSHSHSLQMEADKMVSWHANHTHKFTFCCDHSYVSLCSCVQSASAHANLGAFLHLVNKHLEAMPHYMRALELDPADTVTRNNLMKLQSVLGKQWLIIWLNAHLNWIPRIVHLLLKSLPLTNIRIFFLISLIFVSPYQTCTCIHVVTSEHSISLESSVIQLVAIHLVMFAESYICI